MNFVLGFLYALAAQILTFFQLQGQFKYEWAKENPFLFQFGIATAKTSAADLVAQMVAEKKFPWV